MVEGAAQATKPVPGAAVRAPAARRAAGEARVSRSMFSEPGEAAERRAGARSPRAMTRAASGLSGGGLEPWVASGQLWYFDGARNDGANSTQITVSARSRSAGELHWSLLSGRRRARFAGGATAARGTSVQLESISGSEGADDIALSVHEVDPAGLQTGAYAGTLGVRHPVAAVPVPPSEVAGPTTPLATPAAYPLAGQAGDEVQDSSARLSDDSRGVQVASDGTNTELEGAPAGGPQAAPAAGPAAGMDPTGTTHAAHATWGYESHENYKVIDDKGAPVTSFDINEQWSSSPAADAAGCDWRRGDPGSAHVNGSTFFDNLEGETSAHKPVPQNPQSPLGSTKVQHWGQQWRVGSLLPGQGTLVQTNIIQKYQDHAAHENQQQVAPSQSLP